MICRSAWPFKLKIGEFAAGLRGDEGDGGVRVKRLVADTIPKPFAATRRSGRLSSIGVHHGAGDKPSSRTTPPPGREGESSYLVGRPQIHRFFLTRNAR
jgi:hypothetical protein